MNLARAKVEREGKCRVCGAPARQCDAAHLWDQSLGGGGFDDPDIIVPLCSVGKGGYANCHGRYDAHVLNLLPLLTLAEQVAVVGAAGNLERAWRRVTGQ